MQSVCSESQRQSFFGAPVNRSNPDDINPLFLEREFKVAEFVPFSALSLSAQKLPHNASFYKIMHAL